MEGLGAAASIIAVVQISEQVFSLCQKYYSEVKEARQDIQRLRNEVMSLQDVLTNVADLVKDSTSGSAKLSISSLLDQQDGPLHQCQEDLEKLVAKLNPGQGTNEMTRFGLRALKWPFSSKEVQKLLTSIGRHKVTFNFALTGDLVGLAQAIKDDTAKLNDGIAELRVEHKTYLADERRQKIHRWLSAPDPSSNHNSACKKRQPTTGAWFLESDEFKKWRTGSNSFLWLHGIPGCGKTILCSSIVQDVILSYSSNPTVAVAYFYFDFNDSEKQRQETLLRSLIVQLSVQSPETPKALDALFVFKNETQQPTIDELVSTFQQMLEGFGQTFIIFDALDECKEREDLLELLKSIRDWNLEELHILVTSRRERDIEEALDPLAIGQISIQSALINADIHAHICERLRNDPKLRKWPVNVQKEIENTLMNGANGMFRWVVCQLDALRKCLKVDALRNTLKSLPKTLDDTYARILSNIDDEYRKDAFKVLQWLAYSARPLDINEVAEVLAIEIEDDPRFEPENRLPEPRDIMLICSSLVTVVASEVRDELRFAHFSVKEYLISDRIQTGLAWQYAVKECAEDRIARACLIYLLYFEGPRMLNSDNVDEFPLAKYAAKYWFKHARVAGEDAELTHQLSMELFQPERDAYINCFRLYNPADLWEHIDMNRSVEHLNPPLYYAALKGLVTLVRHVLETGADVNAQRKRYSSPLIVASREGHKEIVRLLLENGADVNAQSKSYGSVLVVASEGRHKEVVRLLLENGANINAQSENGSALVVASEGGHKEVVRLLLENGADVNAQGKLYGSALVVASEGGHKEVVRLLLKNGADVNAQSKRYGSALIVASERGHKEVVRLLLENGADVNAQGKLYGSALVVASERGHKEVVRLLLKNGANVNVQSKRYGNALQAASDRGREKVVELLIENGARISTDDYDSTARQEALAAKQEAVVKLLTPESPDSEERFTACDTSSDMS